MFDKKLKVVRVHFDKRKSVQYQVIDGLLTVTVEFNYQDNGKWFLQDVRGARVYDTNWNLFFRMIHSFTMDREVGFGSFSTYSEDRKTIRKYNIKLTLKEFIQAVLRGVQQFAQDVNCPQLSIGFPDYGVNNDLIPLVHKLSQTDWFDDFANKMILDNHLILIR